MESAILREKRLKKWNRVWKIRLIEESNPYWNDLWPAICRQNARRWMISQLTAVKRLPPARG